MKRNLTGRVIPAALALALAAAPVNAFAATKAVQATGVADENGFISQPGNEYDDATMKKLADNMLEYDEIGKLVEVYSPTFKTVKETYSDKKDAAKDVVKLKSKLLDSSGELADTASTLKGSLDAAKEMIGKVPAMTPTNYAQLYYSSELMDYQADAIALQGDSLEQVSPEQMHIKLVDSTRAALTAGAPERHDRLQAVKAQRGELRERTHTLRGSLPVHPEPGSQRSCDPEPGSFRETAAGVHPGNETDTDIQ